jgi:hypothetical protein
MTGKYHGFANPIPSRKDGTLYKTKRNPTVWYMKDGKKLQIDNVLVFDRLGLNKMPLNVVSDHDLNMIVNGGHMA